MSRFVNCVFTAPWLLASAFFLVPAQAKETCWTVGGGQFFDAMHYCVSSFLPKSRKWNYGPRNLASDEGGRHLAWCEGVRGHGIGQTITIRINNGSSFSRILVGNGYGKTRKSYRENGRVKDVRITTNTGINTTTRLLDQNGIIPLYLPTSAEFKWVKLEILSVFSGSRYRDTCLDFISPDFEFEEQRLQSDAPQANTPKPAAVPVQPAPVVKETTVLPNPAPVAPSNDLTPPKVEDESIGDLGMPDPDDLKLPD